MSILKATVIAAGTLVLANSAFAGANLVPGFNTKTGVVMVKNTGTDPASRSVVTVGCSSAGSTPCPDAPAALTAPYDIAGFPNVAAIKVPDLAAGKSFSHKISFYNNLVWQPGTYYLSVCADAGNYIAETNEADNCKKFKKIVK